MIQNNNKKNFTMISNSLLNDSSLSLKAKGLMAYLESKPTEWTFSYSGILSQTLEGKRVIKSAIIELIDANLLVRIKRASGVYYDFILYPTREQLEISIDPLKKHTPTKHTPTKHTPTKHTPTKCTPHSNTIPSNTNISNTIIKNLASKRVAEYLLNKILLNKPNFKKPNLQSWIKDIDLAIRIDNRTELQLLSCIDWIYTKGSFWIPNILSGNKLRKKFDAMEAQMMQTNSKNQALLNNLKLMEEIRNGN